MRIIGVHGIHDDGDASVDVLCEMVDSAREDIEYREFETPRRWAVSCYFEWVNKRDARALFEATQDGDVIVTHSRGAVVADRCMKMGRRFSVVFMFAPALPADRIPGNGSFDRLWVIANEHDKALLASRFLPFHPFTGSRFLAIARHSLGRVGYEGPENHAIKVIHMDSRKTWLDHTNFATDEQAAKWGQFIAQHIPRPADGA